MDSEDDASMRLRNLEFCRPKDKELHPVGIYCWPTTGSYIRGNLLLAGDRELQPGGIYCWPATGSYIRGEFTAGQLQGVTSRGNSLLAQRQGATSQRNLTISSGLLKEDISDKIGIRHRQLPQCGTDVLADRARPNNFALKNSYLFQATGSRSDQVAQSVKSELKIR